MKSESLKKIISGCLISLTLLGMGGVTISLINVTVVLEHEKDEDGYSDVQIESGTITYDEMIEKYDNYVKIQMRCVSALAMNTNQEYVPVSYAMLDIDKDTSCTLKNESKSYQARIEDGKFVFSNIVPGKYVIEIDNNGIYEKSKGDVVIFDKSQIEYVIDTQYQNTLLYEEYKVSYEDCPDKYYMFMDMNGESKIVDGTFKTDSNGTFFFLVSWELEHDVHIHLVNGGHTNVKIEERYNGGTFIN